MTKCFTRYLIHVGAFNVKVKKKETWSLEKWRGKIGGVRDGIGEKNNWACLPSKAALKNLKILYD